MGVEWDGHERREPQMELREEIRQFREALILLKPSVDKFNRLMEGNGHEPLPVRLDRLEQDMDSRCWYNRAIVGAIIVVLVEAFWMIFLRK